jgi:hypothetical protein
MDHVDLFRPQMTTTKTMSYVHFLFNNLSTQKITLLQLMNTINFKGHTMVEKHKPILKIKV